MNRISPVLQPVTIGGLDLKNRVVMAPLTRSRSSVEGVPPPYAVDYYAQRSGAGLIIAEATNISPQAVGYALTPGIWTEAQIASWQKVTAGVHRNEGKIFLQLWHCGRISHPDLQPGHGLPVSASALQPEGSAFTLEGLKPHVVPRALETDEIPGIVEDYRRAAENAKTAGFDGVEIHSANNYLLEQFIRDTTNKRTDRYGGSIENRLRFPLDVAEAVVGVWGGDKVGIRISPATTQPGGAAVDSEARQTYGTYVDRLSEMGLLYLHVIEGITRMTRETEDGPDYDALRRRFHGVYMGNNKMTLDLAEKELASGHADLFAFGRPFIANPDLVERLRENAPLAEAPEKYYYGGDETGYSDWPGMNGPVAIKS